MKFKTKEDQTWKDLQSSPQFYICSRCVVSQSVMYALVQERICLEKTVFSLLIVTYVFNCQKKLLYLIILIK